MEGVIANNQHIKRPLNSFMVWAKERRRLMNRNNPKMRNAEISKILGEEWRQMPESEKQPYMQEALRLRRQHKVDHPDYRYKPRRKQNKQDIAGQRTSLEGIPQAFSPRILSAPHVTTSSMHNLATPSYMGSLFPARLPIQRSTLNGDIIHSPKPLFQPSLLPQFFPSFCIPSPRERSPKDFNPASSLAFRAADRLGARFPMPKDVALPIRHVPLPSPVSMPGGPETPGVSGVSDAKSALPYFMLKAEFQYL